MRVSVLLSTYNGQEYISDQLDSLLEQTLIPDEIVIVDDGSTDNTCEIVSRYMEKADLKTVIKLIKNPENKGWRQNFMDGISYTSGEAIFFCDQDDIWFKDKIRKYVETFDDHHDIQVVCSSEVLWDGSSTAYSLDIPDDYKIIDMNKDSDVFLIKTSGCAMAVRRNYVDSVIKYYIKGWAHDDFFWKMAALDGSLLRFDGPSLLHRIHGNNESQKLRTLEDSIRGVTLECRIQKVLHDYLEDNKDKLSEEAYDSKLQYLKRKHTASRLRRDYLKTGDIRKLFRLAVKYPDIYRRKRQIAGDFCLRHGFRK